MDKFINWDGEKVILALLVDLARGANEEEGAGRTRIIDTIRDFLALLSHRLDRLKKNSKNIDR